MKKILTFSLSLFITVTIFSQYQFTNYGSLQTVKCLATDNNYVWIGTEGGVIVRDQSGAVNTIYTAENGLPGPRVECMAIDVNGVKWFSIERHGLARYDGVNWTYYEDIGGLSYGNTYDIVFDVQGNVWFMGWTDIFKFDGTSFERFSPPHDDYEEMTFDHNGNIWIASKNYGVIMYNGST